SLEPLVRLARDAGDGHVRDEAHVAGRARLIAAVEKERAHGASRVVAMRVAYAVAAVVVLALGAWGWEKWRAPEFTIDGATAQGPSDAPFVQTPPEREA